MKFYTPKEIAEMLKVNYNRVLELIHMGKLPCMKIGRDYRISDYHLSEFTKKHEHKPYWSNNH